MEQKRRRLVGWAVTLLALGLGLYLFQDFFFTLLATDRGARLIVLIVLSPFIISWLYREGQVWYRKRRDQR